MKKETYLLFSRLLKGVYRYGYLPMVKEAWIEFTDPKHRVPSLMHKFLKKWLEIEDYSLTSNINFFDWVNTLPKNEFVEIEQLMRVAYYSESERDKINIVIKNGKFYKKNGSLFTTKKYTTFDSGLGWAIFTEKNNKFFISSEKYDEKNNLLHLHSSHHAGAPVGMAGEILIINGLIKIITTRSGHYQPNLLNTLAFLRRLEDLGIDLKQIFILSVSEDADSAPSLYHAWTLLYSDEIEARVTPREVETWLPDWVQVKSLYNKNPQKVIVDTNIIQNAKIIDLFCNKLHMPGDRIVVTNLTGGNSRSSIYKVAVDKEHYVLRILSNELSLAQRKFEIIYHKRAAQLRISPEIVYESDNLYVMKYINGGHLTPSDIEDEHLFISLAETIKLLHSMQGNYSSHFVDPMEKLIESFRYMWECQILVPNQFYHIAELICSLKQYFNNEEENASCHFDLNFSNILVTSNQVYLIDWETAGRGNIFIDIGILAAYMDLSDNKIKQFLAYYFLSNYNEEYYAKTYLAKIIAFIQMAVWGFKLSQAMDQNKNTYISKLSCETMEPLHSYLDLLHAYHSGEFTFNSSSKLQYFSLVCLNSAVNEIEKNSYIKSRAILDAKQNILFSLLKENYKLYLSYVFSVNQFFIDMITTIKVSRKYLGESRDILFCPKKSENLLICDEIKNSSISEVFSKNINETAINIY